MYDVRPILLELLYGDRRLMSLRIFHCLPPLCCYSHPTGVRSDAFTGVGVGRLALAPLLMSALRSYLGHCNDTIRHPEMTDPITDLSSLRMHVIDKEHVGNSHNSRWECRVSFCIPGSRSGTRCGATSTPAPALPENRTRIYTAEILSPYDHRCTTAIGPIQYGKYHLLSVGNSHELHLTAAEAIYRNWLVREKPLGLVVSPRSFESVVVLHNSAKHAVSPPSPQADLGRRTQTTCVDNLKVGGK